MRRSHMALSPVQTVTCRQCGHPTLPHTMCSNCGWYHGRQVMVVEEE
jgi:large subunit ribosomal protein L32